MRVFVGAMLASLVLASDVRAKNLYVQPTGCSDSTTYANNSQSQPWCTLQRALCGGSSCSAPNASQAATAGDTVLVSPGTYNVGPATNNRYEPAIQPVNSGTAASPLTVKKNGSGTVEIRATNTGGQRGPVIGASNRDYVVWDGMYIVETTTQNASMSDTGPVVFIGATGSRLLNSTLIGNDLPARADNHPGIRIDGASGIVIQNNRIEGFQSTGSNAANGSCLQVYESMNLTIEHNEASNCGSGIFLKGDVGTATVRFNYVHDCSYGYIAYVQDCCPPCAPSGPPCGGPNCCGTQEWYQNVSASNDIGFSFWRHQKDVLFVNNTIINSRFAIQLGENIPWTAPGARWYNNIIVETSLSSTSYGIDAYNQTTTPNKFGNHNLVFGANVFGSYGHVNYNTRSAFQAATGWESNSLAVDPLFIGTGVGPSRYKLLGGSPALNAGLDVLDLDNDGQTTDTITLGAYITGTEAIGTTSGQSTCGNGVVEAGEQCDGANLSSQTCASQGFSSGTLRCTSGCTFDVSSCVMNPPSAPSGLQATAASASEVGLAWTDTSSNESGFRIERKTGTTGAYSQVGTVAANATAYQDTSVIPSTTYVYRVRATNSGGDSGYSNEATATTPAAPSGNEGLVGMWRFDEGSGTVAGDSSGIGNTGTLVNGPTWAAGRVNTGLSFNGVNQFVRVNDSNSLDIVNSGSVVAWFRRGSSAAAWMSIVAKGTSVLHAAQNYAIEFNNVNELEYKLGDGTRSNVLRVPGPTDTTQFHQVALVWSGTTLTGYLDGNPAGSMAQDLTPLVNGAPLLIGEYAGDPDQDPFNGTIDEVRIYNRVLSSQEVLALFNSPGGSDPPPADVEGLRRGEPSER